MDILDYAMKMELDGKAFYEKSAAQMTVPELKNILLQLAEEELKHFHFFKQMKEGLTPEAPTQVTSLNSTLLNTKNLFQQLAEQGKQNSFGDQARAIWTEALKIEERAEKAYRDEAAKESDPTRKMLLTQIADEEKTHVYLVDNILSFMADPGGFMDSANYRNFMSWEGRSGQ
jgi:rubrerythrin